MLTFASNLEAARSQMAFTLGFHIILASVGVAFPGQPRRPARCCSRRPKGAATKPLRPGLALDAASDGFVANYVWSESRASRRGSSFRVDRSDGHQEDPTHGTS